MGRPSVGDVLEIANHLFPFELAEPWDNIGLLLGSPQQPIERIAFALDPLPETISFAAAHACGLLVTHHPLFLEPVKRIVSGSLTSDVVIAAIQHNISLIALHTNLDAASGGLNDALAALLGLEDTRIPHPAMCARIGFLPEPLSSSEFTRLVVERLHLDFARVVNSSAREIRSVFVACGSGMGYLADALRERADVIVTGDVRYHPAREAARADIMVVDAGHHGLEKHAGELMAQAFQRELDRRASQVKCLPYQDEKEVFQIYTR